MSVELARCLLASGAVNEADLSAALLLHVNAKMPFAKALLHLRVLSEDALERELARAEVPHLRTIVPVPALIDDLADGMCRRLLGVPVRKDARTGTVDVAAVDPFDPHIPAEFAFHLGCPVRLLRGSFAAIEEALDRIERGEFSSSVILRRSTRPPPAPGPAFAAPFTAVSAAPEARRRQTPFGVPGPHGDPTEQIRPSDRPIPLVRRTGGRVAGVLEVHDIIEQKEQDGVVTDDRGEPILTLTTTKLPRAAKVPVIAAMPIAAPSPPPPAEVNAEAEAEILEAIEDPPASDVGSVVGRLTGALSRNQIIDELVLGLSAVAARVALFVVKKGSFVGWACNEAFGKQALLRQLILPSDVANVLTTAVASGLYLGPLPAGLAHRELQAFMGTTSQDIAVIPIKVSGHAALIAVIDDLVDTMIATRTAEQLARVAGEALARIVQADKAEKGLDRARQG